MSWSAGALFIAPRSTRHLANVGCSNFRNTNNHPKTIQLKRYYRRNQRCNLLQSNIKCTEKHWEKFWQNYFYKPWGWWPSKMDIKEGFTFWLNMWKIDNENYQNIPWILKSKSQRTEFKSKILKTKRHWPQHLKINVHTSRQNKGRICKEKHCWKEQNITISKNTTRKKSRKNFIGNQIITKCPNG